MKPADWQTSQFHGAALNWFTVGGVRQPGRMEIGGERRRACYLWRFDADQEGEDERDCSGRLEAFHFIGRQRIRNALYPLLRGVFPPDVVAELILLAEWDPRNGGPGCTHHHRPYDGHVTSGLKIPAAAVPLHTLYFASHWGLEDELQRHCRDDLQAVIDARCTGYI